MSLAELLRGGDIGKLAATAEEHLVNAGAQVAPAGFLAVSSKHANTSLSRGLVKALEGPDLIA